MTGLDFRLIDKGGRLLHARLDSMPYVDLVGELGEPDHVDTEYAEHPWWGPGQGRPALANTDVATAQAMARCLTWRTRLTLASVSLILPGIHPAACGWCDYPEAELRSAVGFAAWMARLISSERATWRGTYGSTYVRSTPRDGTYQSPAWAEFFANDPDLATARARRTAAIREAQDFEPEPEPMRPPATPPVDEQETPSWL